MYKYGYIFLLTILIICLASSKMYCQHILNDPKIGHSFQGSIKNEISVKRVYESLINHYSKGLKKSNKTHVLDSIINFSNYTDSKSRLHYNIESNREIVLSWDSDVELENWNPEYYLIYHYNEDNLVSEYTYNPNWDGDLNNLNESDPHIRRKWFYNDKLLLERFEGQNIAGIQNQIVTNLELYEYDKNQNLRKFTRYLYDFNLDSLVLNIEAFYNHLKNGLLESASLYKYNDDPVPSPVDSLFINYDQYGKKVSEEDYDWKSSGFFLKQFRTYSYDSLNCIVKESHYEEYDSIYNDWQVADLFFYEYYPFGSLKNITEYDSAHWYYGELIMSESSHYVYDSTVSYDKLEIPKNNIPHYNENHMLMEERFVEYGGGCCLVIQEYFYSTITTSTSEIENDADPILVVPNPSSDEIRIQWPENISSNKSTFTLMRVNGQKVMEKKITLNESIDISHLDSGLYFYILDHQGSIKSNSKFYGQFVKL